MYASPKMITFWCLAFACFLCQPHYVKAWDQSELEMFDLIEEMNVNFYEFLKIEKV